MFSSNVTMLSIMRSGAKIACFMICICVNVTSDHLNIVMPVGKLAKVIEVNVKTAEPDDVLVPNRIVEPFLMLENVDVSWVSLIIVKIKLACPFFQRNSAVLVNL